MKTQNIDIPKETIAHFCQHWYITKLSPFSSVLHDDFPLDSDIDVLVEFQPESIPGFLKLHRLQEELSILLGHRQIDLVHLNFSIIVSAIASCRKQRFTLMQRAAIESH